MKIFVVSLTMFCSSLIMINIQYDDSNLVSDNAFLLQGITCESCHGSIDDYPATVAFELIENFDGSLIVHQENSPEFVEGLETFVETHTKSEAEAKYVDRQKVIAFLEEF